MDMNRREQRTTKAPPPSAFSHPLPPPPPPPPPISSITSSRSSSSTSRQYYSSRPPPPLPLPQQQQSPRPVVGLPNPPSQQPQHHHHNVVLTTATVTRAPAASLLPPSNNNVGIHTATAAMTTTTSGGDSAASAASTTTTSNLLRRVGNNVVVGGSSNTLGTIATGTTATPSTTTTTIRNASFSNNNSSSSLLLLLLLLLPPLLLLFLHEMSSSFPLIVLLCCGIIVYSFDLANFGSSGGSGSSGSSVHHHHRRVEGGRGKGMYYTLVAIWSSWVLLSLVVGYDLIFLSEGSFEVGVVVGRRSRLVVDAATRNDELLATYYEEEGAVLEQNTLSSSGRGDIMDILGLALLLARLGVSILLLFHLATWMTLQFQWLRHSTTTITTIMVAFLERILYSTLPLASAAMMAASCYELASSSIGLDSMATLVPYVFALHLTLGIWLIGCSTTAGCEERLDSPSSIRKQHYPPSSDDSDISFKYDKSFSKVVVSHGVFAIHPREGRILSCLLVFLPPFIHIITFRLRMAGYSSYASWDDLFDFILVCTVPYTLHYLLLMGAASDSSSSSGSGKNVIDERWRRSLPWLLKAGTSPAEWRTLRGASVPMTISLLACMAFQHRFLVPLCARASYILNGHGGVISSIAATTFLTLGTIFAYASVWFLGRKNNSKDEYLLGEYHEDFFQLLVAVSATCYGLSCGPKWTFLPVPMLLAESLALWVLTKQLRYAFLTAFVYFTVASILVAYRLTFLNERVEILPGKEIMMKQFANLVMCASIWLILLVGLFRRAPGGYCSQLMRKYDIMGVCLTVYCIVLVVMEFALLPELMPLYSRDNFEVGSVAVYTPEISYFTGVLALIIIWHVRAQRLVSVGSSIISASIMVGKMLAIAIESSFGVYGSLGILYRRWTASSLLLLAICGPYLLNPMHVKMPRIHSRTRQHINGKHILPNLPRNASSTVVLIYCVILLPSAIVASVRLVLGPLVGILTGLSSGASPKLSEIIGYSSSIWGATILSSINHFLPDGGAEIWRRVSALAFIMGMFVSFAAPAFPGTSASSISEAFQSTDVEDDASTGGWGLVSTFLAILLAILGPLELRDVRDSSGRRDTHQLLRLMIFGIMFGCGIAWWITMQSLSKDIFIPIFVTTFSCMAISSLGTVAAVMGYFLDASEFSEAEQLANIWTVLALPVFFVISSISLTAHAPPFGIGGWASTYLSVCGLLAGAFCISLRMRAEKTSITRGYGNMSCVISWLCSIIVVYGRYGVAGVGLVGTTSVAGIHASVLGTMLCAPILLLLEGETSSGIGNRKTYLASSAQSRTKGLVLPNLTWSNWFAPLLAGTVSVFLVTTCYAIFLHGCGLSKFSLLFGGAHLTNSRDHIHGAGKATGIRALDDVATLAKKSVVHTRTMVAAVQLGNSGIWTSGNIAGPLMHFLGLVAVLPSLRYLVRHSCSGVAPSARKVLLALPLNFLAMTIGRGIPSLPALAVIGFIGGIIQWHLSTMAVVG